MKLVYHDYAGHPPHAYLARELARLGHEVAFLYADELETPRGELVRKDIDPEGFSLDVTGFGSRFRKHSYVVRQRQEIVYGKFVAEKIRRRRPDAVISCNTPLLPQAKILKACHEIGAGFVFLVSDVYSVAVQIGLAKKSRILATVIGSYYSQLEGRLLRESDHVVAISEGFLPILKKWGVRTETTTVARIWAPLKEISDGSKDNRWSIEHGLEKTKNIVYAGTMGTKHNPKLLLSLAKHFLDVDNVRIVIISEGIGATWLERETAELGLSNVHFLPYQPYERLSEVLASADVLVAILEPEAGEFSVPSKVLTNMCSGRAQVLAVPGTNLAARLVTEAKAGIVVPATDEARFVAAVEGLIDNEFLRWEMGRAARRFAEETFDIRRIARKFSDVLHAARAAVRKERRQPRPSVAPGRNSRPE